MLKKLNPAEKRNFKLAVKIIVLVCIAFFIMLALPEYSHHLLLVIAALLVLPGIGALIQYRDQNRWIEKKAKLLRVSEFEETVIVSNSRRDNYFYPDIEYEYEVNGVRVICDRVAFEKENVWVPEFNQWGDKTPENKRWWLPLAEGDELPVFVNPRNHQEAVLIKGVDRTRRSHHLSLVLSGLLLVLIWLFLIYFGIEPTWQSG